jgi:hypothetical protein
MRRYRIHSLILSVCLLLPIGEALADLVVVVNARTGVAVMTRNEIVNIFFGRNRQFFNGVEAQPVDLVDANPDRARFYSALVGKELSDINAYWSRQVFSGRMQPPPRVNSVDEVLRWVSTHPGGIGFVELSKADARVRVVYEFPP